MVVRKMSLYTICILQKFHAFNILLDMISAFRSNLLSDGECVHDQDKPNTKNMCIRYSTVWLLYANDSNAMKIASIYSQASFTYFLILNRTTAIKPHWNRPKYKTKFNIPIDLGSSKVPLISKYGYKSELYKSCGIFSANSK